MYNGAMLRPYQAFKLHALHRCLRHAPGQTFTVMFPRQAGKNEISAWLVTSLLIQHQATGGCVIVAAPTLHPQATLSFERTLRHLRGWASTARTRVSVEGTTIRCGEAKATFLSGSPEANVAGHTASLLLIGDEAQDLDEGWFDRQFRPMASSTGASTVLFGTPWQGDSLLEKAVQRNRRRDAAAAREGVTPFVPWHHEVSWEEVGQLVAPYGTFVRAELERLGRDHPVFRTQYALETTADEGRLFGAELVLALEGPFGPLDAPVGGERYCAGLDIAGEGEGGDASVLTIARIADGACEVVSVVRWLGRPFAEMQEEVAALAAAWKFERLVCDATGMGAPISSWLRSKLGRGVVESFLFSGGSKSELGFEMLAAAGSARLRIAPPMTRGCACCGRSFGPAGRTATAVRASAGAPPPAATTTASRAWRSACGRARRRAGRGSRGARNVRGERQEVRGKR